jgi:hypothetical protein
MGPLETHDAYRMAKREGETSGGDNDGLIRWQEHETGDHFRIELFDGYRHIA